MLGHILRLDRFGEPLYVAAKARKSYEEATGLKTLNDRLTIARDRREALDANAANIERDRSSLDLARWAVPLKGAIETAKRLASERSQNRTNLDATVARLDTAQNSLKSAEEELSGARERQEREEPILTAKMTRLEEALSVKAELDRLAAQAKSADDRVGKIAQAVAKERTALTDLEGEAARTADEVETLSEKQRVLTVDPVRRVLIGRALQALATFESAERLPLPSRKSSMPRD